MNLGNISTDELFTELVKRLQEKRPSVMYFIDKTSTGDYNTWNVHTLTDGELLILAKEVKE